MTKEELIKMQKKKIKELEDKLLAEDIGAMSVDQIDTQSKTKGKKAKSPDKKEPKKDKKDDGDKPSKKSAKASESKSK